MDETVYRHYEQLLGLTVPWHVTSCRTQSHGQAGDDPGGVARWRSCALSGLFSRVCHRQPPRATVVAPSGYDAV